MTARYQPEIRHLRAFVVLAEELHFGRAAARLGMAQPHLSTLLARMERELGGPLLRRRGRVSLTPAGEALADSARRVLAELGLGVDRTRRAAAGQAGSLIVGVASTTMLTPLPAAFRAYRSRFPDVQFRLREMHSSAQLDAVRAGSIDVALLRDPPVGDSILSSECILREPFTAILPAGHAAAGHRTVQARLLAEEPFALFGREVAPALYDQIVAVCAAAGFTPRVEHAMNEWHTIAACAAAGLAVSIAPASVARLTTRGVVYRRLGGSPQQSELHALWRRDREVPTVASFMAIVRTIMKEAAGRKGHAGGVKGAGSSFSASSARRTKRTGSWR